MKIRAYIIKPDHTVIVKKVDSLKGVFQFEKGIYCISQSATLSANETPTNFNTQPELIYFMGDPMPVTDPADQGVKFLDNIVIEAALRESGKVKGQWFLSLISGFIHNPFSIVGIAVALTAAGLLLKFTFFGGF